MFSSLFSKKETVPASTKAKVVVAIEPYHKVIPFNESLQNEFNKIHDSLRTCWKRRGKWSCDQTYTRYDVVLHQDVLYECIVNETGRTMRSPLHAEDQWMSVSNMVNLHTTTHLGGSDWDERRCYSAGDIVKHDNVYYLCVVPSTKVNVMEKTPSDTEWVDLGGVGNQQREEKKKPHQEDLVIPVLVPFKEPSPQITGQSIYLTDEQYKKPDFLPSQHQAVVMFNEIDYDQLELEICVTTRLIKPTSKKRTSTYDRDNVRIIVDRKNQTNYVVHQDMVLANHVGAILVLDGAHCKLTLDESGLVWTPNDIPELGLVYLFFHVKCIGYNHRK